MAHRTKNQIGRDFAGEDHCQFFVYNYESGLSIGDDCMFSNSIILRTVVTRHRIFDKETEAYMGGRGDSRIGDHVWAGKKAYVTKKAPIAADCRVAMVTR